MQKGFCYGCAIGARFRILIFVLSLLAASTNWPHVLHAQELDETRQQRAPLKAQIVWDNVVDDAQFVSGIRPVRSFGQRASRINLEPGKFVEFFVPAHELVRVVSCDDSTVRGKVEVWTSDGSGMYRLQNGAISTDGRSMIAAPDHSHVSTARVRCRPGCGTAAIEVYTSRRATPKLLDYYQCSVSGDCQTFEIKDSVGSEPRSYVSIPAGTSRKLRIRGNKRLRIESRLQYDKGVRRRQTHWLRVYVGGVLQRVLTFDTMPDSRRRVYVNDCERIVGRPEFAYVDIQSASGKDSCVVEIRSTHSTFVRADAVGLDLCRPDLNRNFVFSARRDVQKAMSIWDASTLESCIQLSHAFMGGETDAYCNTALDPYLNQQQILQLARNNRIPHSGLQAYMWMRAIASLHYGDADYGLELTVPELAERLRQRTRFRDLMPVNLKHDSQPQRIAFSNARLAGPGKERTETVIGEQHISDAIANVPTTTTHRFSVWAKRKMGISIARIARSVVASRRCRPNATGKQRVLDGAI